MNGTSRALINLLRGWPNPNLLPTSQIKSASHAVLSDPSVAVPALLYGPHAGYEPLREQIATWLTKFYNLSQLISPNRICVTGGASQNLACILQVFSDPVYTRHVWMVSPTYFLACRIFEDSGFHARLRSVPEDDEGIDIEYLKNGLYISEKEAASHGNNEPKMKPKRPWSKIYRHIIYAVPTFSNPSSKTMSLLRRQELVRLAREYDALIITDDVYDQLQWPSLPAVTTRSLGEAVLPRIVDVDRFLEGGAERQGVDGFGNAISNGSFSKIAGPGCRTGWAEGTDKFVYGLSQVGSSRSGAAPSQLTATVMSKLLESGDLQRHIYQTLQPAYAKRYGQLMSAIEQYLIPLGIAIPQSDRNVVGGYFIWFSLPHPIKADEFAIRAKQEESVIVAPGSLFGVYGDTKDRDLESFVRVCFSWEEQDLLVEGIQRLGKVIRRMHLERGGDQGAVQPFHYTTIDANEHS